MERFRVEGEKENIWIVEKYLVGQGGVETQHYECRAAVELHIRHCGLANSIVGGLENFIPDKLYVCPVLGGLNGRTQYDFLPGIRLVHSHWSRSYITALSLVETRELP